MKRWPTLQYLLCACLLALFLGACSSQPPSEEDEFNYTFVGLPEVTEIRNYRLSGWQSIDSRSLILSTSPRRSYLLILKRPLSSLTTSEGLLVSSTAGQVKARFDTVSTPRSGLDKVVILRMYQLNGSDEVAQVKKVIRGE